MLYGTLTTDFSRKLAERCIRSGPFPLQNGLSRGGTVYSAAAGRYAPRNSPRENGVLCRKQRHAVFMPGNSSRTRKIQQAAAVTQIELGSAGCKPPW